jgi:hypothetical protein
LGCAALVLAGLSDVTGSRLTAALTFSSIAAAVAAVVFASHRSQIAADIEPEPKFLADWAWSVSMVFGAMFSSLLSAFPVMALLMNLAEHQLLPQVVTGALLADRREHGAMTIIGLSWLAFQLVWIVPFAVQTSREGIGRAVNAFGLAYFYGVRFSLAFGLLALLAVMLLGPVH